MLSNHPQTIPPTLVVWKKLCSYETDSWCQKGWRLVL